MHRNCLRGILERSGLFGIFLTLSEHKDQSLIYSTNLGVIGLYQSYDQVSPATKLRKCNSLDSLICVSFNGTAAFP